MTDSIEYAADSSSYDTKQVSAAGLPDSDKAVVLRELFNSIRYGIKSQVVLLLQAYPDLANLTDTQGFSSIHWAAKKGDRELLQILFDSGASLDQPTASDSKMMPMHWAASDGKVSSLAFLLEKRQDINAQDANGCTPVVVAAQHDQLDCVIFLIKNGADTTLRDTNGDTALHWGAYKGYTGMVGLLSYLLPQDLDCEDTFGQTPLHLAALRGNTDVVEYLILNCGADTTKRDRNGLNALDLTLKKNQLKTEWSIRKLTHKGPLAVFLSLGRKRFGESTVLMYLCCGSTERELAVWPWRIVFLSNFAGSVVSFLIAMSDSMADLSLLHLVTVILQFIWWLSFTCCLIKSPTIVREGTGSVRHKKNTKKINVKSDKNGGNSSNSGKNSSHHNHTSEELEGTDTDESVTYASVLSSIATSTTDIEHPQLCHTCHVIRPLRSKHCKVLRRCVQRFDHFCPFVGNTLGHDNYKYFISLLCIHVIAGSLWQVTALIYCRRIRVSWMMTLFMVYSGFWMLLILSLLNYHAFLLTINLTTNEHINSAKYSYFKDEFDDFNNPFNLGHAFPNVLDGLFPMKRSFNSRSEIIKYRLDKECCGQNHSHSHSSHSHSHGDVKIDRGDIELGDTNRLLQT